MSCTRASCTRGLKAARKLAISSFGLLIEDQRARDLATPRHPLPPPPPTAARPLLSAPPHGDHGRFDSPPFGAGRGKNSKSVSGAGP
jgi:hypothetical protein